MHHKVDKPQTRGEAEKRGSVKLKGGEAGVEKPPQDPDRALLYASLEVGMRPGVIFFNVKPVGAVRQYLQACLSHKISDEEK